MTRCGTVKMSTIGALKGQPFNADYLLRVKDRLDARGADENPDEVREEAAAMHFEAVDRVERAREMRTAAAELEGRARAEEEEAMALANVNRPTALSAKIGR